jgi:hypothetical protein
MFLPIFHNIGLYIYIVKYKFSIKIPDFFWNILKKFKTFFLKNLKTFKLIFLFKKIKFYWHVYGQILKIFEAYFHKTIASFSYFEKKKKDTVTSL